LRQAYDYWQNQPGNYPKPEHRGALADPPKGASFTKQGDAEAIQVTALKAPKAPKAQATDSIAPTEFPKEWSATSHDRCYHRIHFRYMHPSGGENLHLVTHWVRQLGKMVPKDLMNIWHSQQSTDPKWCPTRIDGTSVLTTR
jgi:hypothetical protein